MDILNRLTRSLEAFAREFKRVRAHQAADAARPRVGLALGGGFARGIAHIGILKVLEEEDIPIDMVAGTSVGAVIGAVYCSGVSARELEKVASEMRFNRIARYCISRYGLCSTDRLGEMLSKLIQARRFEDLKVPLAVAATDFASGDEVVFRSGPLIDAVRASCAYPGIFLPVNIDGRLLVDGMLAHPVPTTPLRTMGADRVIGVFLNSQWANVNGPRHVLDVIGQCFSIAQSKIWGLKEDSADLVLEPDVTDFAYDDFSRSAELMRIGEAAARAVVPRIRAWLNEVPVRDVKAASVVPGEPANATATTGG